MAKHKKLGTHYQYWISHLQRATLAFDFVKAMFTRCRIVKWSVAEGVQVVRLLFAQATLLSEKNFALKLDYFAPLEKKNTITA